jgi:hypothetical protein
MAKKPKKPATPAPNFNPTEWAPLAEAYAYATRAKHSRELGAHDLHHRMHTGELPSARRCLRDGVETWDLLDKASWGTRSLRYIDHGFLWDEDGDFFVLRGKMIEIYAANLSSRGEQASPVTAPRGPRGPKSERNWRPEVAREIARRVTAKEREPSTKEMLQWCSDKWDGWEPDDSAMGKLLAQLRIMFQ